MIDPKLEQLFAHLHRGGSWAYYWTASEKRSCWHQVGQNGILPKGANIYFGVHPTHARRGSNQRARAVDVCAVNCLFAEFDAKDFGDRKDKTLAHIHGLALPPSVIVDSGGGYHCYWLLDEPFTLDSQGARERIDRIQKAWVAFAGSDDGAKDLARVLRVPGTINNKYAPPRPVTFHAANFETLYDIDDLEAISFVPPMPEPLARRTDSVDAGAPSAYAKAVLNGELARVRSARQSTRNTTLNKAAYAIGRLAGAGALDQATVERELLDAALSTGLPEKEALGTIRSGMKAGIAKPRQMPERARRAATVGPELARAPEGAPTLPLTIPDEPDTDIANADRFARQHGAILRYVMQWGWMVYDGKRWKRDEKETVIRLAKRTARSIAAEAADPAVSDKVVDTLLRWAKTSKSLARLDAMIKLAQSELPAVTEDFDKDLYLFNCANGTIDLRTGELRPHNPADMITRLSDVDYRPGARCSTWHKFLDRVMGGDDSMMDFLRRGAGYSMTGDTDEHCFFFLYGTGRNGKSTCTEVIQAALGDYARRVRSETLLLKRDNGVPNDVASMSGARMLIASELPEGRRLDEPLIKDLSGGDTIKARFLHQEFFEFQPQAKIWIFGNHKPNIRGTDEGIWSRVKMIPFEVTIPPGERDPKLKSKLIAHELPGILAWMVAGCRQWMQDGLKPPEKVDSATQAYRAEMDVLAQFIKECCITEDSGKTTSAALYNAYKEYAGAEAVNKIEFGKRLKEKGYQDKKGAQGLRLWLGITLDGALMQAEMTDIEQ
jgi:putative DNA primase/helicase